MSGVGSVRHISCATPDQIWVSDYKSLVLTNQIGDFINGIRDVNSVLWVHSVNKDGNVIYIDRNLMDKIFCSVFVISKIFP